MSFTILLIAGFTPIIGVAAVIALMRLFDPKDDTAERTQAEAEKLLASANRHAMKTRRVRAGTYVGPN